MRLKRVAIQNKRARSRVLNYFLLWVIPFFVLLTGYFLAMYVVVPLLNSRQDISRASFQYTYDIPAITFYSIEFNGDELATARFNNIYQKEYDGRYCAGIFLKESSARDVLKKINQKGINGKIYALKYDKFSLSYNGNNYSEIKTIQKYIEDFQSLLHAQSDLLYQYAVNKIDDDAFAYELSSMRERFKSMRDNISSHHTEDVSFNKIRNSIVIISDVNMSAIDGSTISLKLKDGNAYKIVEDAYIQSVDLYKDLLENISK